MKKLMPLFLLIIIACSPIEPVSNCTSEILSDKWTSLDQVQLQADIKKIDDYLNANGITAFKDPSGLRYVITQPGSGDNVPCLQSILSLTYEGRILGEGTLFDQSIKPTALSLNNLILGWKIAFLQFNKGTEATLYIPSGLAYGSVENSRIPANSTILFKIHLIDFR